MDKFLITGGHKLSGSVKVSKAKNATLPIMAATLLFKREINFPKLPKLSDINFFMQILESLGAKRLDENTIDTSSVEKVTADYNLVRKMRASVLVLGPLLGRFKKAVVSLPGGCAIGSRPVDLHLKGMEALGAKIEIENGYIHASCEKLVGAPIVLAFPSVGATENIMMAAVYAQGKTVLKNCAKEPEIDDLANFLIANGVKIEGVGTSELTIYGQEDIITGQRVEYNIIGDRIEAATYIIAALMTKSEVSVTGFNPTHLKDVLDKLHIMGAKFELMADGVKVFESPKLKAINIQTQPYPGFPTDVQAQMMALMGLCSGESVVEELIFENRFMHVPELQRMGYDIKVDGKKAYIKNAQITSAPVMCTDLRASAALLLAALIPKTQTQVLRVYHIDRGYESIETKLASIGANIKRVKE
jgi:UDP-N-acetylglucosamine 1-carboxyvinyltransferase